MNKYKSILSLSEGEEEKGQEMKGIDAGWTNGWTNGCTKIHLRKLT